MSSIRGGVEQSRERLIALVLLLQRAWQYGSLTQEEIVRELKIDEFPVSAKGPRKVPAYEGNEGAVRQKFERDKARIRELGFEIETDAKGDGAVGYRIDPSSGYAPLIYFTPDEERVVRLALRFCGFGASGAFSVFNEVPGERRGTRVLDVLHAGDARAQPASRAGLRLPVRREQAATRRAAAHRRLQRRDVSDRSREGHRGDQGLPLQSDHVDAGRACPTPSTTTKRAVDVARAWRPEFSRSPTPLDVVVTTNENYADLLVRQYPGRWPPIRRTARSRSDSVSTVRAPRCVSSSRAPTGSDCSHRSR